MIKILIIGATCSINKGSAAMLISTVRTLRSFLPDPYFTILSPYHELDLKNCSPYNIKVMGYSGGILRSISRLSRSLIWNIFGSIGLCLNRLINEELLKEYNNSDIIIDLSGDTFSDDYGSIASISSCFDIILCKLMKKPIVIYAQSIGPFKTKLTESLSRFCLNRVDLLIVRDEITKNYLHEIKIANTIHYTADSAFLLETPQPKRIREILVKEKIDIKNRPLIGISASQHIYDLELNNTKNDVKIPYVTLMTNVVDFLTDKLDAQIVFIPHVMNNDRPVDDRYIGKKIYEAVKNNDKITLINTEYSPDELKGIIGQCDLFIGARMHANIAATSMCVPTLAIAYSHKTYGIMGMLEMENYVLDFRTMTVEEIISKINDIWINKEEIRSKLELNIEILKKKALHNGELVKELINNIE